MFKFQPNKHEEDFVASDGMMISNCFQFENNWTVSCIHYERCSDPKHYPFPKRFEVLVMHNSVPKRVFKESLTTNIIHVNTVNGVNNILEQVERLSHTKGGK